MASLALSLGAASPSGRAPALVASRRVDFHLQGQLVLALEAPPGRLLHRRVGSDPADARRRRRAGRAHGHRARRHRRRARARRAAGQRARGVLAAAPRAGRRQRRRARAAQGTAPPHRGRAPRRPARCRTRASSSSAKASCASTLERQVREHHLEKHVLLPGFRTDVLGCIKGFDLFVMSSVTEGLGTSLLDAMACAQADRRDARRRHSRSRRGRRDRAARAAARSRGDGAGDRRGCSTDEPLRRRMGEAGFARVQRALHRRADGRRDRRRVRARGRQTPRRGHCASPCARLKPQAFIMPRWQSAKSYLTGSAGSSRRSDAVMSRAIAPARARVARQPQTAADANDVRVERHDQLRRRHARPDAEIERVAAHHPAQEQIQPLAGAARRRPRKEVADARARAARGRTPPSDRAPARASRSCRAPAPTSAAAGS